MNIGFWFDYDQTYTFVKVFQAILAKDPSASASGFVLNDRYYACAREGLPKESTLHSLYDLIARGRAYEYTQEEYAAFLRFDERHRLSRVAYSDRILHKFSYDELVSLYVYLIKVFREYIRSERLDLFIFNCVASQQAHLFYLLLRDEGVRVIIPSNFCIEDLCYLADNPYFECPDIVKTFGTLRSGQSPVTGDEKTWAQCFIDHVRGMRPAYSNPAVSLERAKFSVPGPKAVARYLYNYLVFYRNDPNQPPIYSKLLSLFMFRVNKYRSSKLFLPLDETCRTEFIYFPLHYEPEVSTLIYTQYDQASVIDFVARQLPLSCRLVVKEHPVMVGQRRHDFYKRIIARYPNVSFVEPSVSSLTLVERARAVFTLSGTVILEALMLRKPVIYTSTSRFGGFGLGVFTQDLLNLHQALWQVAERTSTDEELIAMLVAIRRHCYRFQFAEPLGTPEVLCDKNIVAIADAVMEEVSA